MKVAFSFFKRLSKSLFARDKSASSGDFFNTSDDVQLPYPIIYTINALTAGRGWIWKGEYFDVPEDSHIKEILMYTRVGTLIIVHVNENGELKSIDKRVYSL